MTLEKLYNRTKIKRSQSLDYIFIHHWRRQPDEQWQITRQRIFERDKGQCKSPPDCPPKLNNLCINQVSLKAVHVDHIRPLSSGGSNHARNLRTLCPVCHGLRLDDKHRSLTTQLVRKGLIPVQWKHLTWF